MRLCQACGHGCSGESSASPLAPCPADAQSCWLCFPLLLKPGLLQALQGSGFQVETFQWEGQCTRNPCRKLTLGRSSSTSGQAENPKCCLGSLPQASSLLLS